MPRIRTIYLFYFLCLCLALWLCIKMSSENMVLVVLLHIGANGLAVHMSHVMCQLSGFTCHISQSGGASLL